jgi:iron complex outermembrane receptor protein
MLVLLCVATLAAIWITPAITQQTREQAIAGMRKVEAKEMDPSFKTAAPFAQKLVDEALARHPEVILLAIHAQPPGHKDLIVASNFGRIGKIGDEDDMRCIRTGKSNLEVSSGGEHFEDELPLKDRAGKTIGALGVVFNYKPGEDKAALIKIANQIGKEMQAQIPTESKLFE